MLHKAIKALEKEKDLIKKDAESIKKMHEGVEFHPTVEKLLETKENEIRQIERAIKIVLRHG